MVNIHSIIDSYFMLLKDTGFINNEELKKVMLLSLIDDYGHEMIECNSSYKKILQIIVSKVEGSSCLFGIGICTDDLFTIDNKQPVVIAPTLYGLNPDDNAISFITKTDIDNLVK